MFLFSLFDLKSSNVGSGSVYGGASISDFGVVILLNNYFLSCILTIHFTYDPGFAPAL